MREYRTAIPEDDFEIARISVESWKHAYKGIMSKERLNSIDPNKRSKGRSNFIRENPLSTLICIESGEPIGFIDYEKCRDNDCDDNIGEVWALYVLPAFIGRGIGKALLSMSAKALSRQGFKEIIVWVLKENKHARNFYERQGFVADGSKREYEGLLEVRYRKVIETATQ